jgi:hypothetical protein
MQIDTEIENPDIVTADSAKPNNSLASAAASSPTTAAPQSAPKSPARMCLFFAQGTCRNGSECKFSHSATPSIPAAATLPPPPPIIISIPPGQPVFSIDVECVATATHHNARSIAQVALVDEWSRPVFNVYVKQDQPVVSYIQPLTGLTKEILDQYGLPLGR